MKRTAYTFLFFLLFLILQLVKEKLFIEETVVVIIYLLTSSISKNFTINKIDIFAPQNIAYIVFFIRLYILPCIAIFSGYQYWNGQNISFEGFNIFKSYLLTLLMFLSFVVGWEIRCSKSKYKCETKQYSLPTIKVKFIFYAYLLFGIVSLVLYFHDISTYLQNIFKDTSSNLSENEGNKLIAIFANSSIFFLPIAVYGFLTAIKVEEMNKMKRYLTIFFSIIITIFFTLNTNRQSMVYPIIALLVGFSSFIKFKPFPFLIGSLVVLYFLFVFQNIRQSSDVVINDSMIDSEELMLNIQVYAGGAQMIEPIFKLDEKRFTIINSFFSSFPVLGKPLRSNSGGVLYNYLFYGFEGPEDQVFLTQAECYVNGGYLLIVFIFLLIGYFYSSLNLLYYSTKGSDFLYRASLYYLILLYNSTILLSFQVMGQFLFYNSIAALIIIYIYHHQKTTTFVFK